MSKTILLADDSVTIQKVIELTFMDQDCEVIAVSTGDEAIRRLDQMEPDLVIADVHMPGANGYEVARQSKERHPGVPVLLLVGTFEPFDEGEMASSGADSHLKKPFDSQELLQLVERLMESAEEAGGAAEAEPEAEPEAAAPSGPTPVPAAPPSTPQPPVSGAETVRLDSLKEADLAAAAAPPAAEEDRLSLEEIEQAPVAKSTEVQAPADATPLSEREPEGTPFRLSELDSEGFSLEPEDEEEEEPEVAAPAAESEPVEAQPVTAAEEAPLAVAGLSDEDVERIARRVAELVGERAVKEVAWEIVPDLAEVMIKDRIQQLESQVE